MKSRAKAYFTIATGLTLAYLGAWAAINASALFGGF